VNKNNICSYHPLSCGLLALLIVIFFHFYVSTTLFTTTIEIEFSLKNEDSFQVYYDTGNGFREQDSKSIKGFTDNVKKLELFIPTNKLKKLRIDPASKGNEIVISSITINNKKLDLLNKETSSPNDQLVIQQHDEYFILKTTATATDPYIVISKEFIKEITFWAKAYTIILDIVIGVSSLILFIFHNRFWLNKLEKCSIS
jgi:hypothetical protein